MSSDNDNSSKKQRENNGKKNPLDNLRPWKPGQSGNPKGRPKRKTLTETVYELLGEKIRVGSEDTKQDELAACIVQLAMRGSAQMMREIWERLDGKVVNKTQLTGPNDGPIQFDLSKLKDAELDNLERIIAKTITQSNGHPSRTGEA